MGEQENESDVSLAHALAGLVDVAASAGLDQDAARAEAEALAATIAEPATGAWVDWVRETNGNGTGERSAEDFTRAASRGRRWRSAPTPVLSELVLAGHAQTGAYAKALSKVCTAATTLGAPTSRVVGNAATAAAAQLAAARPATVGPDSAAPGIALPVSEEPGRALPKLWADVMGQLGAVREKMPQTGSRSGSSLDLGAAADPFGPGAFGDLLAPGTPGSVPPTQPGSSDHAAAPTSAEPGDEPTAAEGTAAEASVEPAAQPAAEPEPPSLDELLEQLDALIGLDAVKAEIHRQVAILTIEAKRASAGLKTPSMTRHLVFVGNPGTGKTTVARLVGGIYRALGLLSKGQLVEVDRSELVAGYLGQTAIKTSEVVASAVGGVLFIDEAYSLAGDQYGTEAVDTLVKEMEDKRDDLVVIVAGYPIPMEIFIAQNPGLSSRFRTTIDFADYSDDELVAIFRSLAAGADYDVDDDVEARFRADLSSVTRDSSFGNGRYARNLLEAAIGRHAWRLREVEDPSVEDLRTLTPEDLGAPQESA